LIKELNEIKERRNKVIDELCEDQHNQHNDYTISLKQNQMKQYFTKIKYFVQLIN